MIEFVKIESKDGRDTMEIEKSLLPQYMLRGWKEAKKDTVTYKSTASNSSYPYDKTTR